MRREFATGFAFVFLLSGCLSLPVDLGPQSTGKSTVTASKTAMVSTSSSTAVDLCCFTVEWSFADDNESAIAAGEMVAFKLSIDGEDQPQFAQTRKILTAQSVVNVQFVTVIPADRFFGHTLHASLIRASHINNAGNPALVNGFTKVSAQ